MAKKIRELDVQDEQEFLEAEHEFAGIMLKAMEHATRGYPAPMITQLGSLYGYKPFLVLTATILSQRSQDVVTMPVAQALWAKAQTPAALLAIPEKELVDLIRPCGMQEERAKNLREVSRMLIEDFDGQVPCSKESLLSLPGVGAKTANLVLAEAFGIPAICVDTHVLRISQHIGIVPEEAGEEEAQEILEDLFPMPTWPLINRYFVAWGQHVCTVHLTECVCKEKLQAAIDEFVEMAEEFMGGCCDDEEDGCGCGSCCC